MLAKHFVKITFFATLLGMFTWLHLCQTPAAFAQISFSDPGFFTETITTLPQFTPVGVTFAPDGRLFIWQKPGIVRIFKNGQLLPTPFIDISAKVNQYQDRGLLGLALDPNFVVNRYVYLLYVLENGGDTNSSQPRTEQLTRVTADPNNPDVALAASEVVILGGMSDDGTSHAIGTVRFAVDGKMFVSVGDGANFSNVDANSLRAQDLTSLNGKILRINPDGSAPSDNPFYEPGNPTSNKSKVWAYGLRNPFRFTLRPVTGSPSDGWPYIGNVGWNTWEEQVRGRGVNFGWPCYEGGFPQPDYQAAFAQCRQLPADSVTQPLYVYDHTVGFTAIGGAFYSGILYPAAYRGNYFFADYGAKWMKRMVFDANDNVVSIAPFATNVNGPVDLEMGPDGTLYYVALNSGEVGRIRWGTGNQPPVAHATATPTTGYSPLTVTFSSADSADPEGGALTYFWDFGDGTTSTLANPSHTYVQGGVRTFTATLRVTDPTNLSSTATIKVTVGSTPPKATILSPATGTKVDIGTTVTFQGKGTDPDDGTLPDSALSWTVIIHHNSHIHPLITATGSTGSFEVVDHGAGNYSFEVILTVTDSSGLTDTTSVTLPANSINAPFAELDFTYNSRDELELAGWDFLAKTVTGATRDTEQTGNLAPDYNQAVHPNILRVPLGSGEIWEAANDSQNTLFRDLPSDWVSLRLKLAAFNPVANYQQVGLLAYQDDDNYVDINRPYVDQQQIELFREVGQATTYANRVALTNTGNLILRLDRNAPTNTYTGYYSTDGGVSWVTVGSTVAVLSNTRLGIQVGSNLAGTVPVADLQWAQVLRPTSAPVVSSVTPTSGGLGQTLSGVLIKGSNFVSGATCSFGAGITVNSCTFNTAAQLTANVTIATNAATGARTVSVTNPDTQSGSLVNAFTVTTSSTPAPGVSGVNPTNGVQGQTLTSVVISGRNFVSGATCSFGVGITVNSCAFNSATQLTANLTIAATAATGARTVSVTNPDAQSGSLVNAFTVTAASAPTPVMSSVTPTSGAQSQTLTSVVISGSNFVSGATCSFGAGITVNSCTFNSATQLTANLTIAATAATGARTVSVTNPNAQSGSLANAFSVTAPGGVPVQHFALTYSDSAALKAGGWDFFAKTATGVTRNTEQAGALAVDYNQTTHPGVLRVPIGSGEIWEAFNNSQNTFFRNLPSDWMSLRLNIAAFNPVANYQQVGLLVYQDDDTYVSIRRNYNSEAGGADIGGMYEVNGVGTVVERRVLANSGNLILRLDRNLTTNAYSLFYSTNGGTTWTSLVGIPTVVLNNPRVGIQVGANAAGNLPVADLAWVEIVRAAPGPVVSGVTPSNGLPGQTLTTVVMSGSNFVSGAVCNFGSGITVNSCTFNSAAQLTANVTIAANATAGPRTVSVTNPDTQSGSLTNAFTVITSALLISSVNPTSGLQGQTLTSVAINGNNFASGATCSFGAGITVNSCTFNSATRMTANITIAATAAPGGRTVSVTNPNTQSASLANAFNVIQHINLAYSSSTVLKADGWDFLAKTAANVTRNTEQSGALAVNYDQVAHPGVLRIPVGNGEVWQTANNSQNTLFRTLPSGWTSIRVKLTTFNPVANYQQVGLLAYQDDDNYVNVNRPYVDTQGGQTIELFRESSQVTSYINRQPLVNTGNVVLRLDRNAATNTYTGYYSVDGGVNWVALGSTVAALVNPRLGIQVGSNEAATTPVADLAWIEIVL